MDVVVFCLYSDVSGPFFINSLLKLTHMYDVSNLERLRNVSDQENPWFWLLRPEHHGLIQVCVKKSLNSTKPKLQLSLSVYISDILYIFFNIFFTKLFSLQLYMNDSHDVSCD